MSDIFSQPKTDGRLNPGADGIQHILLDKTNMNGPPKYALDCNSVAFKFHRGKWLDSYVNN